MAQGQSAAGDRKITPPPINVETQEFWDVAGQGKLLVKKCTACGEPHFYPRTHCPFCFSDKTEWVEASGRGTSLAVGQHISNNIYVEVITDPKGFTATQLEISLSKALSLLSKTGTNAGSSANLRYSKDY